ncbi:MAG: alpha/beta fold hydrolase [Cytophagales bacterium]|nr:alpha/beta fold hydrolase [Armatimonadota bacterium]
MSKRLLLFVALLVARIASAAPPPPAPNYDVPLHGNGAFIPTPKGRIYYEKEGQGPLLILVAGGPGGGHTSFHPWFNRLAKTHTVVYFDNLGRGRSDRLQDPKQYTVERDADDIESLRIALKADKIAVLGHSYGGMPALAYALKYPAHLDRLILSDTLHSADGFQQNIDNCNREAQTRFPEVWEKLMALRKTGVKSSAAEYGEIYSTPTDDLYWYDTTNAARMFRANDPPGTGFNNAVYLAMLGDDPEWKVGGTMKAYDPRPRMKTLAGLPTLICVGRSDRVATPGIAWELNRLIPASRLVIFEKSGHRPWVEESDRYFQTVSAFLSGK